MPHYGGDARRARRWYDVSNIEQRVALRLPIRASYQRIRCRRWWEGPPRGRPIGANMDTTTLLIIVIVAVLLLGGGGWYGRGRWY